MATGAPASADAGRAVEAAIAALKTENPASALPLVERALRSAPGDARLWHLKGLMHRADEHRENAIPALQRAATLAPGHALIAHGLASTLLEAGLPSVDAFAQAMRLAPGDPQLFKGMVAALVAEGRSEDAAAGLERALAASPQWADGHAMLSDLRWMAGEREGFARSFDDALQLFPADIALRAAQLNTLLHAEQYEAILERAPAGRKISGDLPVFTYNEAAAYAERGDMALADALFGKLGDSPDSAVQLRRVRHLLRAGRVDQAVALIDAWLPTPHGEGFWPYASVAWRMSGDPRSDWLQGDPDLVGIYDLRDGIASFDQLAERLRALHTTRGQPLVQSVRGGTQTDGNLFQRIDPVIVELRELVRRTTAEHASRLPPADPRHPTLSPARSPIRFSGSWSVRLQAGGFHANHVHPMGWFSSALYISLPPDLGHDQAGWLTLGDPASRAMPLDVGPLRMVEPKPGRLVLFPSWMWHGTRPFGEGERMTVAFDVAVPNRGFPA